MHEPEEIVQEWLGDPSRWWTKDPVFDRFLAETYGEEVEAALRGELDAWAETPRGALALVILFDQFARNIHRDTPRMYAGDQRAVSICLAVIDAGADATLSEPERQFLYMPLMHSENRAHQERCLEKFRELGKSLDFAQRHADIVFRFGRFPHRNAILGRESTPEEIAFLEQPGSSF
jgi:uncharacterized protein (DUF924 family)